MRLPGWRRRLLKLSRRHEAGADESFRSVGGFRPVHGYVFAAQGWEVLAEGSDDELPCREAATRNRLKAALARMADGDDGVRLAVEDLDRSEYSLVPYEGRAGEAWVPLRLAELRGTRAPFQAVLSRPATALVDAQAAVTAMMALWDGDPAAPVAAQAVGVLAHNARTLAWAIDPDMALASAESALATAGAMVTAAGGRDPIPPLWARPIVVAARIAARIHLAHGRDDDAARAEALEQATPTLATAADRLNRDEGKRGRRPGGLSTLAPSGIVPTAQAIAENVTLADALHQVGARSEAQARLAGRRPSRPILVPLDRSHPDRATRDALILAGFAAQAMAAEPGSGIRLALEAHALFASGARLSPSVGLSVEDAATWIDLLHRASRAYAERYQQFQGLDLAHWITVVNGGTSAAGRLDPAVRDTFERAVDWARELAHTNSAAWASPPFQ